MTFRERLRSLFPAAGLPYRLFDSSVLLIGLAYFWYVGSPPSAVTLSTVGDVYAQLASPENWGKGIMVTGFVGVACAYISRWWWPALLGGYIVLASVAGAWSAALLVGATLGDPSRDLALKAFGSALLFAWIARGRVADVLTADELRARP